MKLKKMFQALLSIGLFRLNLGPAEGVIRGDGGHRPDMPVRSMMLKPYRITAALSVTEQDHAGRIGYFDVAAGAVVTLPRSTGSGAVYTFFCKTTITSNAMKVQVANADDTIAGVMLMAQDAGDTIVAFETASTSDTWSGNGSTTGGIKGDLITFIDIAEGVFAFTGTGSGTGTEATPFSAAVS